MTKYTFCAKRSLQDKTQPYLSYVTLRVLMKLHAKFHANWSKTVGARGIHTHTQRETDLY